jgi:hypothetical protein
MPIIAIGALRQVRLVADAPAAVDWTQRRGVDEMAIDSGRPLPHLFLTRRILAALSQSVASMPCPAASAVPVCAL